MAKWQHNCGVRCHDHHVVIGGNGQQRPDVNAKGVNDGGTITMGNFDNSTMDSETVAMGNGAMGKVM